MFRQILTILLALMLFQTHPASAQHAGRVHGGDTFVADETVNQTFTAERNVFAVGNVINAKGTARGDMHLVGFDVDQGTEVGGNLLATGMSITLAAPIAGDVSATGFSLRTTSQAPIGGNAFLIGNTVTIDGPVAGALTAFGQDVLVNARIDGDVWLASNDIEFGPDAQITGRLLYTADEPMSVPDRVISADRVQFERQSTGQFFTRVHHGWERMEFPALPAFLSLFAFSLMSLAFFIALAAIFQSFLPKSLDRMQSAIQARPGQVFLLGVVGLSMLFGMVPIVALTIFGIPLVPIVLLSIVTVWTLGYALGVYAVAQRMVRAFGGTQDPTYLVRLLAFTALLIAIAILNFIPFVGWVVNYTAVLLGIGAMTGAVFNRMLGNPGLALDVDMQPIKD